MKNSAKKKRFFVTDSSRMLIILIVLAFMMPFLVLIARQQQSIKQEAATTHQVVIKNFTMNPPNITVYVGDTVTWTNQDNEAHDAASNDGSWSTPLLSNGESGSVTFDEPGTFEYRCRPHQATMNGFKVTVLPASAITQAPTTPPTIAVPATVMPSNPPAATAAPIQNPTLPPQTPSIVQKPTLVYGGVTNLSITLLLHGLGNAGDNANPSRSEASNKNPQQTERLVRVTFINASGQSVLEPSGTVTYNQATGDYRGILSLGSNFPAGTYTVKVRVQNYLQKIIARNFTIVNGAINTVPAAQLITGDVDGSNTLDQADYLAIVKCLSRDITGSACYTDEVKKVDLNDDGTVTISDVNLLLRELSLRTGD